MRHVHLPREGASDPSQLRDVRKRIELLHILRAVPGHWEGDLLCGACNSHIATLVERHSRFTMLVKVQGKDTVTVVSAITKQVKRLPVYPDTAPSH